MHQKIFNHRIKYGANWLTVFGDNQIPWRQLSLQEFLDTENLMNSGSYTETEVEDILFRMAVLDPFYIENIDILPAGLVTTVASNIYQSSGPLSIQQISHDLNLSRYKVQDFMTSAVMIICSVFAAYKPEDVYNLKYDVFMTRLAMAEKRLLELKMLQEPLSVLGENEEPIAREPVREKPSDRRRREILESRKAEAEAKFKNLNPKAEVPKEAGKIISSSEMSATNPNDTGHDMMDKALWQHDARQGLEHIYPEYFKMMKEGTKITPELINKTKGISNKEVEQKHREYIDKLKSGEIKPEPSKFIIADKLEGQPIKKEKGKVVVKRK